MFETGATTAAVNDIVLTVINDGDGIACGFSYDDRCRLARKNQFVRRSEFRYIARECARRNHKRFGTPHPTLRETSEAGDLLNAYYVEHLKEMQ